jgi:hypothetical protein
VEGVRVARVALWVDLPALRRHQNGGAITGEAARRVLMEGHVRVLAATTYLVDIGTQRRCKRLESFFAVHWPRPGEDLSRREVLRRDLEAASGSIGMGEVQVRALELGWGLGFRRGGGRWSSFGDPDLGVAWARGELGREQDPDHAKGLEADLARLLAAQSAR